MFGLLSPAQVEISGSGAAHSLHLAARELAPDQVVVLDE